MAERRTDTVRINTAHGIIEIPWASRDALLHEIRHLESGRDVVKAFEDVGTSRPVDLDTHGKGLLIDAIHVMSNNAGGLDKIPAGLADLRHALVDELDALRRSQ